MQEPYPLPRTAEHDFATLRELMKGEPDFPATYCDWQALWTRRSVEEQRRGHDIRWVDLRPSELEQFCGSTNLRLSWGALTKLIDGQGR